MRGEAGLADRLARAFAEIEAGRGEEAARLARDLARERPDLPGLPYLNGLIALDAGEGAKAARYLKLALAARPDEPPLLLAMARAQAMQGRDAEAEAVYRRLLAPAPDARAARRELAALLVKRGLAESKPALYEEAVALDPDSLLGTWLLAEARARAGETEAAIRAYRRAIELDPDDRYGASLALARLGAAPAPQQAPAAFVRNLFDQYAETFDAALVAKLRYRAPELLLDAIRRALGAGPFDACDIGCGTGLMGAALRPLAARLDGIDLSDASIAKARARGVYEELLLGDIAERLAARQGVYDLVVAADVLVYVGELAPIFSAVFGSLRPGGGFAFSVERGEGEGWTLQESSRFAHSETYIRCRAAAAGFAVTLLEEASTREDRGAPVPGLICVLRKPA